MTVTACIAKHFGTSSPIAAYRSDMAGDVADLVADGMTSEAAWLQVVDAKLTDLRAERARIEQTVADAYAKTAAGAPAAAPDAPAAPATAKDTQEAERAAKREAVSAAKQARQVARETERSVFRELTAMPDMVGKSQTEVEAAVRARLGDVKLDDAKVDLLVRAIHKDIGKRSAELERQKHRDPAVLEGAIQAAYPAIPADPSIEARAAFAGGFGHAVAGKTKSTLSGEHLSQQVAGYEAARRWIEGTEEGAAFFEGRPSTKLKNTGVDLKRHMDALRAQMQADESDVTKAWKQIESATARASLFAPLLPDGVTPGYRLYIEDVRSNTRTFKEWLDKKHDWAGSSYYRSKYSAGRSNSEYMLTGERYPLSLTHEDRARFKTDDAYRAQWLRDAAADYLSEVQAITTLFQGTSSVAEAASKWSDQYFTRDVEAATDPASAKNSSKAWELNEAGRAVSGRDSGSWSGGINEVVKLRRYSAWTITLVEKEATIALPSRAQQLVPPKLDRVTRDGQAVRDGNVTPAEVKARYGFADVGFGNWVGAQQDQDHLNYAHDAFADLAMHFGVKQLKGIGFGGRMHFTIGALGHGKFAAHFHAAQPHPDGGVVEVINVTNTRGDGTVYHEWTHALDHFLGGDWKASVRPALLNYLKRGVMTVEQVEKRAFDFLFGGSYWTNTGGKRSDKIEAAMRTMSRPDVIIGTTAYKSNADQLGKDYWGNDAELIARASEAWAADTLGHANTYLVNPEWVGDGKVTKAKGFRGTPYPSGDERKAFNLIYTALAKSVQWEDGKPTVKLADFKAALPAEITAGDERRIELRDRDAMTALRDREAARREEARLLKEDQAAQAKQQEQRELDELAEQAVKALQPPIVDGPADIKGPLSDDDLSNLFDEAAAELRESTQEQPDAPGPGETIAEQQDGPASGIFSKWTQADLEEILDKANNADFVAIAGDPIWNVPDIHEVGRMGKTAFLGDGMFETTGKDEAGKPWSLMWDGGGAMKHTTGGRSWTNVNASGRSPWPSGVKRAIEAARDRKAAENRPSSLIPGTVDKYLAEKDAAAGKTPDPTAAKLIAEAAKLGVTGASEALTGLAKLFGGGKGRLNSFPAGFDEDTYNEAKPHFQAALKAFQEAGKTLKDLFKMLIGQFGDGIKDYALQFAKDEKLTSDLGAAPSASMVVADKVKARLKMGHAFDWRVLFGWADEAFGGTQAEGKYTSRDAYDAMEAGVNRYLIEHAGTYTPAANREAALVIVSDLIRRTDLLPTQSKRTAEQDEYQQFSTVPALAFMANWVANINPGDVVLEPSAGIGGLAVFAHNAGASLVLNELSSRRAAVLQQVLPSARVFHEDAAQIDNILPDDIKPSVVVMNPPFSSAAGRGIKSTKEVGGGHIEQALDRLVPGGRLIAVSGKGMALDEPAFSGWWKKIRAEYDVRAVIPMDGGGYAKYGTTFDNVLIVIDKVKPKEGRNPITTPAKDYTELIGLLAEVRDDRPVARIPASDRDPVERDIAESALDQPGTAEGTGKPGDSGPVGVGSGTPLQEPVPGRSTPGGRSGRSTGQPGSGVRQPDGRPDAAGQDAGRGGGAAGEQAAGDSGVSIGGATTQAAALTDSVFEGYAPQRLQIAGAQPHPGPLVQSAAMASVLPPAPTYTPNLPKATITKGLLSLAQLEAVVYAGQAHEQMLDQTVSANDAIKYPGLKSGIAYRRGFFIGDGTGVGKGREIGGVILDNLRHGRKKHVWISEKQGLLTDAKRDFKGVGGDDSILFNQNKTDAAGKIDMTDGVIFTTYSTLRSGTSTAKPLTQKQLLEKYPPGAAVSMVVKGNTYNIEIESIDLKKGEFRVTNLDTGRSNLRQPMATIDSLDGVKEWRGASKSAGQSRLDQLVAWLGADFDGVIAFDEAHNAGNAIAIKGSMGTSEPSAQAEAVVALQARLPNARILYVSATGATEVSNLSFATRLGLWGMGTSFPTVHSFVDQMTAGGLATMELVARDMKQMGAYLARSLSFDGVSYSRVEHELTPLQTDIYNKLAEAWQVVLRNMMEALQMTGAVSENGKTKNANAVKNAKSAFWGTQQRFFNQIITSMQMPTVLEQIERDLAGGDAVILQLVNTNEAQQERALAKQKEEGESVDLEELDLTPRDALLQMVEKAFPVSQMEDYIDDDGKRKTRPVMDSEGKPVQNRQAVAMRDQLLKDLQDIRVPDGPLELILNAFGPDITGEVTGRKQRVVRKPDKDGNVVAQLEKRGASAARADAEAFLADKKRILIFSDAGGTGYSFHADLTKVNQRKRKHYLLQPGWRANKAVQGLGRSHRSNQKQPPHFGLTSTNIPAHKRFLSSIARRLDQLGALTKGQRDTSSGGLFSEKDNLESVYATQAVKRLLQEAKLGQIPGINFLDMLSQLGLEDIVNPDTGQIAENKFPPTTQFLNRLLSLTLDMQEKVFTAFSTRMDEQVELAAARGMLDTGMQTIHALSSKILQEETIYTDERTGAETQYVELELTQATRFFAFPTEKSQGAKIDWMTNAKSGRVWARVRSGNATLKNGAVVDRYRMFGTGGMQIRTAEDFRDDSKWDTIDVEQARELWDKESAARPATYTETAHMIVGAMLPIWDRIKTDGAMQVARTQTTDGRRLLGRVIAPKDVADLRRRLDISSVESKLPPEQIMARILKGDVGELANGWTLERARVSDDLRIEIKFRGWAGTGVTRELVDMGVIQERISWTDRYFIPTGSPDVLAKILKNKPLVELKNPKDAEAKGTQFAQGLDSVENIPEPSTVESATAEIASLFGKSADGVVTVAATVDGLPPAIAKLVRDAGATGVTIDKKHIYIVADRVTQGTVRGLVMHELGVHYGMSSNDVQRLTEQVKRWAQGTGTLAEQARWAINAAEQSSSTNSDEEALAYMVQVLVDSGVAPGTGGLTVRRFMAIIANAFKAAARALGLDVAMTPQDMVDYAYGAAKMALRGQQPSAASEFAAGSQFSADDFEDTRPGVQGRDQTDSEAFKRWFKGSKVVDAQGRPLVVYHGTSEAFNAFKTRQQLKGFGIYFGAPPDLGSWFGSSPGIANNMTRVRRNSLLVTDDNTQDPYRTGANVMSVYLSLQNPRIYATYTDLWTDSERFKTGKGMRASLERQGYDGILIRSSETDGAGVRSDFVAFRPEQIKSATGNRGTFDPANPDIRFSAASTIGLLGSINQRKVRNTFADMIGSAGAKVSWWDKHLGTQYAKAEKFPAYKAVFERVQSYIEDVSTLANEAAGRAPAILPKMETWKDLKQSFKQYGISKADADALAKPIFRGTLTDKKVYSDAELRNDFGLSDAQVTNYRQFYAAVNTSLDQVVAADVLKLLGDKNPALRELALADRDQMRLGINEYLTQEIAAARGPEKARLTQLRKDIRNKYERIDKLKDEGYAPLMRFGQYKVFVSNDEGESLFFGLYESKAAANRMARELAEDPEFAGATIEQGVLSQEQYKLFNSLPVESLEMFAEAIGAEQSEVFQSYLRLAKNNRSALKRLIHRKGTAGFSEDVPRVLASFVTSNARLSAAAMNLAGAKTEIENIRDGDVKDEAIAIVESVQNPAETAAAARSLMFMNFIGGSIASAVVNLTQPITMTLPYLSQFGGLGKASARLMTAGKMVASGRVADPELKAALKRAEDDGTVSPQEIHHLQAQAMGTWGNSALSKQAAFIWGAPFSLAEQFNRRVSFIAAYLTAQEQGIDNPFAFAEKAVTETQGLYNKGNMPNLSRTAIGAAALQFKQFSIHYLEWMKRMWNAGEPGSDERRAGRRAVLIALALLMVAAGSDGLPFAEDLDDLVDTIGQALGYNTNSKKTRRDFVAKTLGLGDMSADVFARGLSALPGVPLDVSLRMSMGNLVPASGILLRSNTDRARDVLEIAGPAGGMARQYLDATQKMLEGNLGGAKGFLPVAAQNSIKAMEMWSTGEARDQGGRKIMAADEVDGLMKFMGFNPAAIARESQKMGMIRRSEQLAKNVEGEIAEKWARGFADRDTEAVKDARQELADWNARNPEDRITISSAQILQRVKKLRQSRAQRFITSASPERRTAVREALQ